MTLEANVTEAISLAADLSRTGQWNSYLSHIKVAYGIAGEQIWEALSRQLWNPTDIVDALSAMGAEDTSAACRWLLPAVGRLSTLPLANAKQLLRFADTPGLSYRYMVAQQLRPHVAAAPELGRELGEYLRTQTPPSDPSVSVWAAAFASGAPDLAAAYMEVLLTGAEADTRMAVALSGFLPLDNDQVRVTLRGLQPRLADTLHAATAISGDAAWAALCHIAGQSPRATQLLHDALQAAIPDAAVAIAASLYHLDATADDVIRTPVEDGRQAAADRPGRCPLHACDRQCGRQPVLSPSPTGESEPCAYTARCHGSGRRVGLSRGFRFACRPP
jgi:hypothetical protein